MILRVVSNNRPDEIVSGPITVQDFTAEDAEGGAIVVLGLDIALDPFEWFIPFGQMLQVYH